MIYKETQLNNNNYNNNNNNYNNNNNSEGEETMGDKIEVFGTVRSGQQVYARGPKAQLIILGNVSSGAEVIF